MQENAPMVDPANDFIRDYQALAQQSWDAWARQFQQQPAANPFAPPPAPVAGNDMVERTLAGLKGYFDWMQAAAAGSAAPSPGSDWRQQLQQMFGGAQQPFAQAFGGIDSAGAEGFMRQWQSWLQAARPAGFGDLPGMRGPTPAFGLNREQQMQQQALATALLESMRASVRYQELIQRANTQGMQRLQDKLAEPGRQIDSLKGLYDLWVDASEEAYAEIALSDEFREVYGEMVNTQMRVRQLQQQQTEQLCQQLGVPTRSEVSSLGERLQALRREFRASRAGASVDRDDEIVALRRELAALKRQLAGGQAAAPATSKAAPSKAAAAARKTSAKAVRKPAAAAVPSPRKRK
ncbi:MULTISPECIES: poly(R)-hydroxyalkanoic acid synthase subunit PhaE [Rhodanobacter]|uniref:poly(R)-hydroxyalkanoic acid synthase subunit PhaE n=2 Tax=Rhodanobacteraceae TaxID=1775411 RepID=UPI001E3FDB43|nr:MULTISPECIES: poly(R)-hydroxyalkanoic acid synthase subunit PhaE [Rhodanobacter]UJJ52506.1 pha synthase subunit protein [Rhodanobacter denitrificans]UJM89168.1 pha synthase subunit protein [Rhodanobacter denitrificans]UJN21794.1 pha synthase subunit protein [Rhodanobacter denitrificans]